MTRIVDIDGDTVTVKAWAAFGGPQVLVRVEQGDDEAAVALNFDEVRELIAALKDLIGESPDAVAG